MLLALGDFGESKEKDLKRERLNFLPTEVLSQAEEQGHTSSHERT